MSEFTVYRGKCSPSQLRDILLLAMTVNVKEIEEAMPVKPRVQVLSPAEGEVSLSDDHIFVPEKWCWSSNPNKRVEFCHYELLKAISRSGVSISSRTKVVEIPKKTKDVVGISSWVVARLLKKSKSGNFFEATQNLEFLEESGRGDGPALKVTFNICVRERALVTRWGLRLHSRWLDCVRAVGVKLDQVQE